MQPFGDITGYWPKSAVPWREAAIAVVRPLPFRVAHGRPEAEAVAQPHDQASFAAQDLVARDQRVPELPQPAAPAPGVPVLWDVRRS
jgi:hypothetical protein